MADVKLLMPDFEGKNLKEEVEELKSRFCAVLKELEYLLCSLDEENVMRAGSVYAENIDTAHAKISDAQIGSISADKLTAGTIDAEKITIKNMSADSIETGTLDASKVHVENLSANSIVSGTLDTESVTIASGDGRLVIYDTVMAMYDKSGNVRMVCGLDTRQTVNGEPNHDCGTFRFDIYDKSGNACIHFDGGGNAVFSGVIDTADDVNIGNQLNLNNAYEEGGVYFCNKNGNSMASVVCDRFGDLPGLNITADSGLYINGSRAATEQYVQEVIRALLFGGGSSE